ncbi:hypothetical protein ACOKGD_01305 [Microbacterium phosphatis]|uniref:hypothetical protein n=1 Tax=Microbacterium phosphatis TaxID=3140248 RepID=UPI00314086A6
MTTIDERCAEILPHATEMLAATVSAGYSATGIPSALSGARALRAILARGPEGITSAAYLEWHGTAVGMIDNVIQLLETGEVVKARELMTDPRLGLHGLTIACAGQPGW